MEYKYGTYPDNQFEGYKKRIHSKIHWLLIYAEEDNSHLNDYFEKVQLELDGLNELIHYPTQIIEIMNLVESARIEFNKENYSFKKYRKIILDIHDLIDMLPEEIKHG